jgi:diguanylate cyclase (GGDEF)-like protein
MSTVPVAEPTTADALALVRAGGRRDNEHHDLVLVRRVSGLAAALVAVGVLVLACLAAPRPWGVPVVFATAALGSAVAVVLARGRLNLNWLHLSSIGLIAGLCAIDAATGPDSPFRQLILLQLITICAIHTPRRCAFALALAAIGLLIPVALGGDLGALLEWATRAVVWSLCGAMAVLWTASVRLQRGALVRLSRIDALTGLGNRRAFDEALGREIALARRAGSPLAIALGDIDHFKEINDRVGHTEGDRVLQDVAAALRGADLCFRWAGDEFALILPGAGLDEARTVAARVAGSLRVGMSFGCSELEPGVGAIELLERADHALRARKSAR